jgi:hypothetical protein
MTNPTRLPGPAQHRNELSRLGARSPPPRAPPRDRDAVGVQPPGAAKRWGVLAAREVVAASERQQSRGRSTVPERSRNSIRPAEDCAWQVSLVIAMAAQPRGRRMWPRRRASAVGGSTRLLNCAAGRGNSRPVTYAGQAAPGAWWTRPACGTAWSRMLCALHHRARSGCPAQCNVVVPSGSPPRAGYDATATDRFTR